jgi:hypothetical protein
LFLKYAFLTIGVVFLVGWVIEPQRARRGETQRIQRKNKTNAMCFSVIKNKKRDKKRNCRSMMLRAIVTLPAVNVNYSL